MRLRAACEHLCWKLLHPTASVIVSASVNFGRKESEGMKRLIAYALSMLLMGASLEPIRTFAQSGDAPAPPATTAVPETPPAKATASALFAEASNYAPNKFKEFAEKKVPFDPKLLDKTLQEQREMAARFATELSTRTDLAGEDFYYLGMLYSLADNDAGTLDAL